MSSGQNYFLLAMDMDKVGGPLSVVKVFTQIWTSQVHSLLLQSSAHFVGYSVTHITDREREGSHPIVTAENMGH